MPQKYEFNNIKKARIRNRFKCYNCNSRFANYEELRKHTLKYHKNLTNEETVDKYLFDLRNPGPHICVICKKNECEWNSKTKKYYRICNNEQCKQSARARFSKNMKKIYGTDNLLNDPEHQAAMLANRKISGVYKFDNNDTIDYVGTYELDFLQHCEKVLGISSLDIATAPSSTYLRYRDTITDCDRYYIPDFFIPKYNLVIEIKDSSKFPISSKLKTKMKENAVIKSDKYNYIKIVDKNYEDYDNLIKYFRDLNCDENGLKDILNSNKIIIIPFNDNLL